MFVLDTNVVSALAPARREPRPALVGWIGRRAADLYVSAVTIAEIEAGAAKLRRLGADRRADLLARWIEASVVLFGDRILAFDVPVARVAGMLHDKARATGIDPGFPDVAIAATAHRHGFMLLTRNVKHFAPFGVPLLDPFTELPAG